MTVCMVQQPPLPQQTFFQLLNIMDPRAVDPLLKHIPDVLSTFGLTQRVVDPTHERGGTLDLVITDSDVDDDAVQQTPLAQQTFFQLLYIMDP